MTNRRSTVARAVALGAITWIAACGESMTDLEGVACAVGQEWGTGESCVVSGGYRFHVMDAEFACYTKPPGDGIESTCSNRDIESEGFSASRIGDTANWRINAVP